MSLRKLTPLVLMAASSLFGATPPNVEERVNELLGQMTLEEKLGQMSQSSYDANQESYVTRVKTLVREGKIGSVFNVIGASEINMLQQVAVEQTRLKIPLINGLDVIHGFRTEFPIPLAQSCSWNPALVERAAHVAGTEAAAMGIHWTFAPMLDLSRDPRWGRISETSGEDPYLSAQLGAAAVRGYQGYDFSDRRNIAACAKHYVGYGATEGGRDYNTTLIPETELRNVYLPMFKAAKDAGVLTFMSAFNDLNGVPSSGNPFTLRKILREEWGFEGFVVSDWESVKELMYHGLAANERDAARLGINAGVDMEMVSSTYRENGAELLKTGKITLAQIDEAVRAILRVKFKLGLFEHPYTDAARANVLLAPEHLKLARELATQSMVLLKNEQQTLPLKNTLRKIAVIGPLANSKRDMRGAWHCDAREEDCRTVWESIKDYVGSDVSVGFERGLRSDTSSDESEIEDAVKLAKASDAVILCIGEGEDLSGEARCRAFLDLPGAQDKLVARVAETGKPITLVIFAGRPLTFSKQASAAQAVLYAWHPGTMAGPAICDLLFGRVAPSGHLTESFPRTVGQIPLYYNHRNTGRPAQNEVVGAPMGTPQDPQGYFSKYLDVHSTPEYPFGFGLTYTTFKYSDLAVSSPDAQGVRTVSVAITNTGERDGVEVSQLYIQDPAASITRPVRELKGFQRISLKAGERRTIAFLLPREAFGFFGSDQRFVVEPGEIRLWVGGDSLASLGTWFTLE